MSRPCQCAGRGGTRGLLPAGEGGWPRRGASTQVASALLTHRSHGHTVKTQKGKPVPTHAAFLFIALFTPRSREAPPGNRRNLRWVVRSPRQQAAQSPFFARILSRPNLTKQRRCLLSVLLEHVTSSPRLLRRTSRLLWSTTEAARPSPCAHTPGLPGSPEPPAPRPHGRDVRAPGEEPRLLLNLPGDVPQPAWRPPAQLVTCPKAPSTARGPCTRPVPSAL